MDGSPFDESIGNARASHPRSAAAGRSIRKTREGHFRRGKAAMNVCSRITFRNMRRCQKTPDRVMSIASCYGRQRMTGYPRQGHCNAIAWRFISRVGSCQCFFKHDWEHVWAVGRTDQNRNRQANHCAKPTFVRPRGPATSACRFFARSSCRGTSVRAVLVLSPCGG